MNDSFIVYLEEKIREETTKRDTIVLIGYQPGTDRNQEYYEQVRVWWCHESRRQAYEDSLIQYKLTELTKK